MSRLGNFWRLQTAQLTETFMPHRYDTGGLKASRARRLYYGNILSKRDLFFGNAVSFCVFINYIIYWVNICTSFQPLEWKSWIYEAPDTCNIFNQENCQWFTSSFWTESHFSSMHIRKISLILITVSLVLIIERVSFWELKLLCLIQKQC